MCSKYKNSHGTVFIWCEIANGKEHRSSYLNCFTDGIDDYYNTITTVLIAERNWK